MTKVVKIYQDDDPMDPSDYDGSWKLHSFSPRDVNYTDPTGDFVDSLQEKLKCGLAFVLSCFEHGERHWSLKGEGTQCQWDTAQVAGVLVWEHDEKEMGATSYSDRAKDARCFLETYNCYINGDVYGYAVETLVGEVVESCFGFYGNDLDYMVSEIKTVVGDEQIVLDGQHGSFLAARFGKFNVVDEDDPIVSRDRARLLLDDEEKRERAELARLKAKYE